MHQSFPSARKSHKRLIINHLRDKYPYFAVKRGIDVAFSVILLILVCSWLMPLLAIVIKLDSRGPLFFRQKRIGYLGKSFICIKFRTMIVNDQADQQQASENDPRVTRAGRFLRRTGLDELPQILSILKGDMSLIGPRPHMLRDNELFSSVIGSYNLRHLVRPGITGIAQVKGYRGQSETMESIYRRYQWDEYYVRHTSASLDAKIFWETILLTGKTLFKRARPGSATPPVSQEAPCQAVFMDSTTTSSPRYR